MTDTHIIEDAAKWQKLWDMVDCGDAEVTFFGRMPTINTGLVVNDGGDLTDEINLAMVKEAAARDSDNEWDDCLKVSELPDVDEAIKNFTEDATEDNAVCMVRAIMRATK